MRENGSMSLVMGLGVKSIGVFLYGVTELFFFGCIDRRRIFFTYVVASVKKEQGKKQNQKQKQKNPQRKEGIEGGCFLSHKESCKPIKTLKEI